MDSRQYMDLMEAYVEVYAPQEEIDEADSLAAMQARREKRLKAQRKREGTTSTGRDFGHDYSLTPAQQKARRDAEFKAGTKKEEVEEYIDFLIDEGYDCSDLTWDEIFEEYESLDEGLRSAVKRLLGKKDAPAANNPMSRGDQLRKKYNVGPEKSDTSAKRQILNRTRAKAERDKEQYGGSRYSKSVADKSQAAHDRYLRGGYSKYGADDRRGSGNKARRRAAALKNEEFDFFDTILEFLYVEGYVDTLEEAEWMMANIIDEEAINIILGEEELDEAITSEKGKAKAAEMIAKRTHASGRAKAGEGDNVALIKHIRRSNKDGLLGTPPNRKVAGRNWPKSYSNVGTGNKAARRAAALKNEEFEAWLDEAMTNYERNRKRAAQRAAARNAARDAGKTGVVPGVGYVTPRRERETWTDESGKTRHAKGL